MSFFLSVLLCTNDILRIKTIRDKSPDFDVQTFSNCASLDKVKRATEREKVGQNTEKCVLQSLEFCLDG